ncbi:hypothetical protein DSO57_1029945 [Entomophthora muscae]|uniref:Uncharacterized protein n=1 Tax=Entomophthora muscae TaxID=34485 RepID=A0ACC2TYZ1_9FUNG|nr:hypothetical protein DSO57_1029945 [Entomophthora muscae]
MKGFLALCICAVNVALRVTYGAQVVVGSRIYIVQGQVNTSATKGLQWLDTGAMLKISEAKWEEEGPNESMNELHSSACALYDSQSPTFFCFGGTNPSHVGHRADASSLSFNIETRQWSQVNFFTPLHPSPRYGHTMVTIPGLGIGLLGGAEVAGARISDEFWLLDRMNSWVKATTHGLSPAYRHTLSVVNTGPTLKLIAIGGKLTSSRLISTKSVQVYSVASKSWALKEVRFPIQERHSHSAAGKLEKRICLLILLYSLGQAHHHLWWCQLGQL